MYVVVSCKLSGFVWPGEELELHTEGLAGFSSVSSIFCCFAGGAVEKKASIVRFLDIVRQGLWCLDALEAQMVNRTRCRDENSMYAAVWHLK